jgi:AcrR family transcriptional regulator
MRRPSSSSPPLAETGTKRARTRARLIEVAAEVIGEKGLDRTALEDIAARAGMSRGAIYGNFGDKEELFLAVAASRWTPIVPPPPQPGETLKQRMRRHGEAVADAAESRRKEAVGATSFVQYALTHEPLRARVERANAHLYEAAAKRLAAAIPRADLPMPAKQFVRVVHALTDGLVILHALTPTLITRSVIIAAFEALA